MQVLQTTGSAPKMSFLALIYNFKSFDITKTMYHIKFAALSLRIEKNQRKIDFRTGELVFARI